MRPNIDDSKSKMGCFWLCPAYVVGSEKYRRGEWESDESEGDEPSEGRAAPFLGVWRKSLKPGGAGEGDREYVRSGGDAGEPIV